MAQRLVRGRALSVGVCALLLFQAAYAAAPAAGADPGTSLAPSPEASILPTALPDGSPTPIPLPSPTPSATPADNPSPTLTPRPAPLDPATGLKAGATEIVAKRTADSQTFDNHDGTYTSVFASGPEFYQPAGSTAWLPIEVGFAAGTKQDALAGAIPTLTSGHAPATVSLFDLTAEDFVTVAAGGQQVGFALPLDDAKTAKATSPIVDGVAADYLDVLPGVDLRVIARPLGSKSFLILHTVPVDPSYTFRVDAPGLTLVPQDNGSITLVDAAGKAVGMIPHPYALDSTVDELTGDGRYTDKAWVTLGADSDGAPTITISVDPTWLATAVYPVYVDPTITYFQTTSNTADAHTASAFPGTNFGSYQLPTSPNYYEMWLGLDPSGTSGRSRDYVRWDVSGLCGVTVESAAISTHPWHQYYNAPTEIRSWVARLTSSFSESTIDYDNAPSGGNDLTFIDGVEGATSWSSTSNGFNNLVQDWIDLTNPSSGANYGVRIWDDGNGATYWKRLLSSEQSGAAANHPTLKVTWHNPVTTLYPTGGGRTSSTTLTWSVDGSWATSSAYHVDLDTDSGFGAPIFATSGDVTSAAHAWSVPVALTPGTTYFWRVKVKNSAGVWTPFSASGSFVYDLGNLGSQSQFGMEPFSLGGGDQASVNVSTGNLVLTHPIVSLPIRGSSVSLGLTYNSQDPADVGLGVGWRLNMGRSLAGPGVAGTGTITFTDVDGARYTFTTPVVNGNVTTYTRPDALFATLTKDVTSGTVFTLKYRDLSRDLFDGSGRLTRTEDRYGNGVTLAYNGSSQPTTITDTAGSRAIALAWTSGHLSSITDWAYIDGFGVVQTAASGSLRASRFFYDGSGNLIGWADPLNTAGSCPTGGSHLTCLSYGTTLAITKTQTVEGIGATSLTTSTRTVTTQVTLTGSEVTAVKDAEQVGASGPATSFARGASQTVVVRPGTPSATTTYGYVAATDPYARIQSVWRLLNSTNIEQRTIYDGSFPTLPATVTDNYGALLSTPARTVTTTYVGGSLGLVARTLEPLTASPATNRQTDFTYDANNDLVQRVVSQDGSDSLTTTTRYCYDAGCTLSPTNLKLLGQIEHYISGGAQNADTNVTTNWTYDNYGQCLTETRHNRGGTSDDRVTRFNYDSLGNQTSEVVNYDDGSVSSPGDDITTNATTGARTDLTTVRTYDTAGNQVSTADPRRAIEAAKGTSLGTDDYIIRTTFDALGAALSQTLSTTPASLGGVACSPDPACRQSSSVYDEFGGIRQATTYAPASGSAMQSGTEFDRDGRATRSFEDTDGSGSATPAVTAKTVYDVAGRVIDAYDRVQVGSAAAGSTNTAYDGLGRATDVTTAYNSSPTAASTTHSAYDALDRLTQTVVGYGGAAAQTTTTTYDLGGRAVTTNDGFACQTAIFDYWDHQTSETEGLNGSCATVADQTRTVTSSLDGLGRTYRQEITDGPNKDDRTQDDTYDAVGNRLTAGTKTGSDPTVSTTFTINLLDQVLAEIRPDGSRTKTNLDPAGNETDRCVWTTGMTVGSCLPAGTTPWTNAPATATTAAYDARNQRISLATGTLTSVTSTTTYNPAAGYQVSAIYLPTGSAKEYQTLYTYDARQRLATVTNQLCVISSGHACSSTTSMGSDTYAYDDNDNRTQVNESNGSTSANRFYCYDAQDRLVGVYSAAACPSESLLEHYGYDVTGNRTTVQVNDTVIPFAYNATGQLCKTGGVNCTSPNVTYDSAGRTLSYNGWVFAYDSDGRLTTACEATSCEGSGFNRVDYTYDGEGHRSKIVETDYRGTPVTTTFTYQGDAIASESVSTGVSRTFVTDDTGRIVKVTITGDSNNNDNASFVVTWNGHGDALGLWRESDGALANSYTYSTWGTPTTTVAYPFDDLGFRYLYVGASAVQSDSMFRLGLLYMRARHYAPVLGRFLQPDPARTDGGLYTYAANSPASVIDPLGLEPTYVRMNWAETWLCHNRRHECLVDYAVGGWAWQTSLDRYPNSVGQGRGDAVRHCTWQCLMTLYIGSRSAMEWGYAHEATETTRADLYMDLHNNRVGEVVGEYMKASGVNRWSIDTWEAAWRACEIQFNRHALWIVRDGAVYYSGY